MSKYKVNEKFFLNTEKWTERESYFLGWLLSDGHHNVNSGNISIKLQEQDKHILESLKNIIEYSGPLLYVKRKKINDLIAKNSKKIQNRWCLTITRRTLSDSLLKLNVTNDKTNHLDFPKYLDKNLYPHFLRGFYEGDGTISYSVYKGKVMFEIHLLATKEFCKSVQLVLSSIGIKSRIIVDNKIKNGNVLVKFSGNESALKFFNYIYANTHFVLKRKLRKFLRLINYMRRVKVWKFGKPLSNELKNTIKQSIKIATDVINNAEF